MNCLRKKMKKESAEERKEREEREEIEFILAGNHVDADCCRS